MIMDRVLGYGVNSDGTRSSGSTLPSLGPNEEVVAEEEIGDSDVLLGRGKSYTKHPGIVRFQAIINQNIDRYFAVSTHQEKKDITDEIVKEIQSTGRFLRYEPQRKKWIRINHETARTKVAQAIQYRQRRRAKGYDISSIEGLVGSEAASSSESRKRRGSFTDPGRQSSILPSDQTHGHLGGSQGLLTPRGQDFLSSTLQSRWAPLSRSDPGMGMTNLPQQQIPRNNGRLSYEQSLDLALSHLQQRQQDNQQDRFLANRRLESMGMLYSEQQPTSQNEPDDTRSATAIGDCLEPIQFEALQAPTGSASLPSVPFASSPAGTAWQVQLLQQAIQQQQNQNAVFARPHQASNNFFCPSDPISVHQHCYGSESSIGRIAPSNRPAASLRQPPQIEPESQADSSSFLDPLPFEIGTAAPMPEESKSNNWNDKPTGNHQVGGDQDRKLSPRECPL